ncbi:hypothetical protein BP5796_07341 [Coleophoma crateriformis]|uniref:tRNA (guanine(9)-N1)-methyltransferase n=1 Tax=Coleophoma crateriformis TaxID=565419 RepID=A0A3D8RIM0_9HELO|nr:hypothetical protein BP5796_07341 [Coleophoma crateriformis]
MSDTEERPSKIRRLEKSEDTGAVHTSDLVQNPGGASEVLNSNELAGENSTVKANAGVKRETDVPLSKNQLKKLRKQEQWDAGKDDRKLKRREKHKAKQARKAEARAAQKEEERKPVEAAPKEKTPFFRPVQTPVGLILDCDFNDLMTDKELISLGAQLTRCYSDNRTSPYRSHVYISSWGGKLQTRFETVLANTQLGWKGVRFTDMDFVAAATELHDIMKGPTGGKLVGAFTPPASSQDGMKASAVAPEPAAAIAAVGSETASSSTDAKASRNEASTSEDQSRSIDTPEAQPQSIPTSPSIVYLTADSPNTIDRLSPYTSYIIGGIVDKNRHKGLCYKRACERGIPTAKLPIGEYMTMQSRTVLTVNHVVEIMLKWLEKGDWGEAFLSVIPKRKEAKLRVKGEVAGEAKETKMEGNEPREESMDAGDCGSDGYGTEEE